MFILLQMVLLSAAQCCWMVAAITPDDIMPENLFAHGVKQTSSKDSWSHLSTISKKHACTDTLSHEGSTRPKCTHVTQQLAIYMHVIWSPGKPTV